MSIFDVVWHWWFRRPYKLALLDNGQGQPVLLLHGVGASGAVWRPLARLLNPQAWRVIVPDLLGFGDSPKPQWGQYRVQDHARAIIAVLMRLGVKGPITIVGHSMGCLVATHIAAIQPRLVKRLVLYEPPLYAEDPNFKAHLRRRERYFALYEFIAAHPQLAFTQAQFLWRAAKRLVGLNLSQEVWIPFERSLRNTIIRQTTYKELHTIQIPTDIVHGRFDVIVARKDLRRMYRNNPHIKWHMVSDVHGLSARSARYLAALLNGLEIHQKQRKRQKPDDARSML